MFRGTERQIGQSCGNTGLRFSRCDARPSRASAPVKPSISSAVEVSNSGPLTRSQLFNAYLVQRIALCAPFARSSAVSSAIFCRSASSTHSETSPIRSASVARQRLAGQQIVFRLGKPAQQRPDDAGDIAGRDAKPGVTVDDARGLSADRDVGEDADDEAGADRDAVDGRDDRLVAVDDVVDEVLGLLPGRHARDRIVENALDQLEIAAGRKRLAGAGDDDRVDVGIVVDVAPDMRELGMGLRIDRIVGLGPIECQPQDSLRWIIDLQAGVGGITVGHGLSPFC